MPNDNSGFFGGSMGASPEEVSRLLDRELINSVVSNAPQEGKISAMSGALLSRALGGMITRGIAGEDFNANQPQVIQAVKMKALQDKVSAIAKEKGIAIDDNPEEFSKIVAAISWEMGMPDIGQKALEQGRQMQLARRKQETEEDRAGTYAASVAAQEEQARAQERIATAHDRTTIEAAKIAAGVRVAGGKKPKAAYPTRQMNVDIRTIIEDDPKFQEVSGDLTDYLDTMSSDAATYIAKQLRDDPDLDPAEVKDQALARTMARVFTIKKSFNPFGKKEFGLDETVYFRKTADVIKAFKEGKITESEAKRILEEGF